ncbi:restriction endonuclease [Polaromonas sp. YR568]|uniref:restriction endonuclease n=1 Tax=Polaromonas sp. YR568 TaxID=1855301 RepID=UPI00398BBCCD
MTNKTMWMVRAGEGGFRFDDFKDGSRVSIGWFEIGDLSSFRSREDFNKAVAKTFPKARKGQVVSAASTLFRFVREIKVGDTVITYGPSERVYLVGRVTGDYKFSPQISAEQPNGHDVEWRGQVSRDALSVSARNSLGSTLALFQVPVGVAEELIELLDGKAKTPKDVSALQDDVEIEQVDDLYKDIQSKGFEFIKDKVNELDWEEMQELVAGLLRAMGYKTRISPNGADRGKDIVASPDGLGFEDPRIVVEVKHRGAAMGSQEIRSFLGGRHANDKGLYVSTGGFTKDARYEAERAPIPVTLMDIDDLVKSLLEHYEKMDIDMQRLIPLRKVYWPA